MRDAVPVDHERAYQPRIEEQREHVEWAGTQARRVGDEALQKRGATAIAAGDVVRAVQHRHRIGLVFIEHALDCRKDWPGSVPGATSGSLHASAKPEARKSTF
jgi:hypothetical protein